MSTLAVLLIIGSAVVGPIEAQTVPTTCVWIEPAGPPASCPQQSENLPMLCERAMREVGAKYLSERSKDDPLRRPEWGYAQNVPQIGWWLMTFNELAENDRWVKTQRVECIPVPQGYRR